jgi:insertion element IS1 protein InsB
MNCNVCAKTCVKNGFQKNGKQRYLCTFCKLSQQKIYIYKAYYPNTNKEIAKLLVNSCGITPAGA